jgi:glycine dehydrogenase subunit 1
MSYLFNTDDDRKAMLQAIGAESIEELFRSIPAETQLSRPLNLPAAMGELELQQHVQALASQNQNVVDYCCFLGGGAYDHFVPAVVDEIASRGEFYTSYTPYQPEVAQGNLQAMFEYQTMICQLTGLDVSNASLYDGGSAAVEAVLMAISTTRRSKVVTCDTVHPHYRQILATYLQSLDAELVVLPATDGVVSLEQLQACVDDTTACVLIQSPNFLGSLEDVAAIAELVHQHKGLLVTVFDPIGTGILARPGDQGADIAVAEGQTLGTPLLFGGPYLGIMACREGLVRRLPGRIAGQTVDRKGQRCWVLTLQTREQHIRREKATSNICTNQGLFALRATIFLSTLGPQGLADTARLCLRKAHYAARRLTDGDRFSLAFEAPTFKEFVVRDRENRVGELLQTALEQKIFAGIPLGTWYPDLADCFLVAVTEKRTRDEIDRWANCLQTGTAAPLPAKIGSTTVSNPPASQHA